MAEEVNVCGVVMPISAIDNCDASHWADVFEVISEAIEDAGFVPNMVSNADEVSVIHKRIIQNLYENPIVVCDVSGKNPNVMFELGLRLAFDKPTIIIKDDKTSYSFDTSSIEHLEYPRDLRFSKIVDFKEKLSEKIKATVAASADPSYTTFLKNFGEFKVAKIEKKEVSGQEYLLEEIKSIHSSIMELSRIRFSEERPWTVKRSLSKNSDTVNICLRNRSKEDALIAAKSIPQIEDIRVREINKGHFHLFAKVCEGANSEDIERQIKLQAPMMLPKKNK